MNFWVCMGLTFIPIFITVICICACLVGTEQKEEESTTKSNRPKPKLKELTEEQIKDIHSRGKITPAEVLEEWEELGLCAPGDAIGSANVRCKKMFDNCHDCLVDYANQHDEYTSFYNLPKYNLKDESDTE